MFDHHKLILWFQSEKRDLPWRNQPTPYAVWVSEVMLQQTQVSVVIPYFERWMKAFPTIEALAKASLDDVIKLWEGLGYYSRARNLHEGARYILQNHEGNLPQSAELLEKIKGIGDYTKGAILSFAFHEKYPAVDGNVMRVLSRYFLIEEDIGKVKTQKHIREITLKILPEDKPWITMEAIIELGAKICQKKPHCSKCPLKGSCQGFLTARAQFLPKKSKKNQIQKLFRAVAVIECKGEFLVRKAGKGEIMEGLHEFPYFEIAEQGITTNEFVKIVQSKFGVEVADQKMMEQITHTFTNYKVFLFPFHMKSKRRKTVPDLMWLNGDMMEKAAFSSGHKKILSKLDFTSWTE